MEAREVKRKWRKDEERDFIREATLDEVRLIGLIKKADKEEK